MQAENSGSENRALPGCSTRNARNDMVALQSRHFAGHSAEPRERTPARSAQAGERDRLRFEQLEPAVLAGGPLPCVARVLRAS